MLVFDAETGFPLALLRDNAYLTDLRTAAAGALAARLLAPKSVGRVAMLASPTIRSLRWAPTDPISRS